MFLDSICSSQFLTFQVEFPDNFHTKRCGKVLTNNLYCDIIKAENARR